MNKRLIITCLALTTAALSVPALGMTYSLTGLTDRWETIAEVQAEVDANCAGYTVSHIITTIAAPHYNEYWRAQLKQGDREAVGQAFEVPEGVTDTKLCKIALWGNAAEGSGSYTHTLHLYDIGVISGTPPNSDYRWTDPEPVDLLGGGAGDKWVYSEWGTKQVVDFLFCDEPIYLIPGHTYVFEQAIESGDTTTGGFWTEYSDDTEHPLYPDGAFYVAQYVDDERGWVYGSKRNAYMAVYLCTPEPATILLLGLGGLVLRKRKA